MNSVKQQNFIQVAVDLSLIAVNSNIGGPFGAIIVKNGNIVGSSGSNVYRDLNPGTHAEVRAIRDACRNLKTLDLSGCQIYSSAEPCPMCLAAIYWAQISEIYYCNSENNVVAYGYTHKSGNKHQRNNPNRNTSAIQISEGKSLTGSERVKTRLSCTKAII